MKKHICLVVIILLAIILGMKITYKINGERECIGYEKKKIALTFDDGPSAKYTPMLLDGLKERNVVVSFFLMGENISGNEKIVERMEKEGHLIGNHTYHHVQLDKLSQKEVQEEIYKTNNMIYEITGKYPEYMRPPFGAWKKDIELTVHMIPVFWDIDTLDWKSKNINSIIKIVEDQVEDEAIILMHDAYETSVEAALKMIDEMKEKGYEFVTVDCLLRV